MRTLFMVLLLTVVMVPKAHASEQGIERDCFNRVSKTYALISLGLLATGVWVTLQEQKTVELPRLESKVVEPRKSLLSYITKTSDIRPIYNATACDEILCERHKKNYGTCFPSFKHFQSVAHDCEQVIEWAGHNVYLAPEYTLEKYWRRTCNTEEINFRSSALYYYSYPAEFEGALKGMIRWATQNCCSEYVFRNRTLITNPEKTKALKKLNTSNALKRNDAVCTLREPKNNKGTKRYR